MSDKRYLEKHGKSWRVQVRVPPRLQAAMGKKKLLHPLHTSSLADACRLKWDIVAKLKAEIRKAEAGSEAKQDTLADEALRWRDAIEAERPTVLTAEDNNGQEIEVETRQLSELMEERAGEIWDERGNEKAELFRQIASGKLTPITSLIGDWLSERSDMKKRQHSDYRRAVEKFAAWSGGAVEGVTRKVAGRYVTEEMVNRGKHPKTANKDISSLSSFWRWLMKRGHANDNPWQGQSLAKRLAPKNTKRPFTDEEVGRLFKGTNDAFMLDLMKVAALSGMRMEEIASLTIADTEGKVFNIRDAKTAAGVRKLPAHSGLSELVDRRAEGKGPTAFLFEEMGGAREGAKERGQIGTKRFITYRRRLGIDERGEGQRQSNVDFHSFRRWFMAKARDSLQGGAKGYDPWTIAEVVGHDTKGSSGELKMTMGLYPGPQTMDAKRACVEAVKLPA